MSFTRDDNAEQLALDNCAREPVHTPGRIQSFAAVVGFDLASFGIRHHSANLSEICGCEPDSIAGSPLEEVIQNGELIHGVRGALGLPTIRRQRQRIGRFQPAGDSPGRWCEVAVWKTGDVGVLELEPVGDLADSPDSSIEQVRSMLASLNPDCGVDALLQSAAESLRALTGFDRVMGYRFLSDGAGDVAAESRSPAVDPYLGLRYPAADIPSQVRKIALQMPFRMICDIHDPHVPISGPGENLLDLTMGHSRGVSPIHIEYLNNMGVAATMNLAMIVRGELWGLFAFHHYRPRKLSPDHRSVCELYGQLFSIQLQQEIEKEILSSRRRAASTLESIRKGGGGALVETFDRLWQDIAAAMEVDGLAIVHQKSIRCYGHTPAESAIRKFADSRDESVVMIDSLSHTADLSRKELHRTAGMLSLKVGPNDDMSISLFRNEIVHEVRWGGQPVKDIQFGPNGPRLHPRASFQEYMETVTGKCKPWTPANLSAASELRAAIMDMVYHDASISSELWQKQKKHQDLLIAELNHRVKNILALVRSIARQTRDSSDSLEAYATAFEKRIAALSTAHDLIGGSGHQWARIADLLRKEITPFRNTRKSIELSGPPFGLRSDVAPVMALVFHEMASNSVKYGVLAGSAGALSVKWFAEAGGLAIHWRESGLDISGRPERRGFGLTLIERAVPYECKGESTVEFTADGLSVRLWLPGHSVSLVDSDFLSDEEDPGPPPALETPLTSVLVVEDNMVLALELEKILLGFGCPAVDTVPDVGTGQQYLAKKTDYSLAILDINLGESTSFELAGQLAALEIPLIFVSGYNDHFDVPEPLQHFPRLTKPVDADLLLKTINSITDQPL